MNNEHPTNYKKAASSDGSLASYVTGYILSLLLTANAYFIVVHRNANTKTIVGLILALAGLQMIVQVYYFLHLGRGPKPVYNVAFFIGTVTVILMTVLGSVIITDNLHYNMSPEQTTTRLAESEAIAQVDGHKTGACDQIHINHKVTIINNHVTPLNTSARLCDTMTFINLDDVTRDIAFGAHPGHTEYGGQTEITVRKNYPKIITLNQAGTYRFHDHYNEKVTGYFTVTK